MTDTTRAGLGNTGIPWPRSRRTPPPPRPAPEVEPEAAEHYCAEAAGPCTCRDFCRLTAADMDRR